MISKDDTDLQSLKKKLTILKQQAQPENKDEMIQFLV
jgi:hypothetical protein